MSIPVHTSTVHNKWKTFTTNMGCFNNIQHCFHQNTLNILILRIEQWHIALRTRENTF